MKISQAEHSSGAVAGLPPLFEWNPGACSQADSKCKMRDHSKPNSVWVFGRSKSVLHVLVPRVCLGKYLVNARKMNGLLLAAGAAAMGDSEQQGAGPGAAS